MLQQAFAEHIPNHDISVYIGGKSMGRRVATTIADTYANVRGCIVYGYPFHPPNTSENLRTQHLCTLQTPTLIIQGTHDPFGKQCEWTKFGLSKAICIHPMDMANHDLKPLVSTGHTLHTYLKQACDATADFIYAIA